MGWETNAGCGLSPYHINKILAKKKKTQAKKGNECRDTEEACWINTTVNALL